MTSDPVALRALCEQAKVALNALGAMPVYPPDGDEMAWGKEALRRALPLVKAARPLAEALPELLKENRELAGRIDRLKAERDNALLDAVEEIARLKAEQEDDGETVQVDFPSGNWFADIEREVAADVIAAWNATADSNQLMVVTDRTDVELALRVEQARGEAELRARDDLALEVARLTARVAELASRVSLNPDISPLTGLPKVLPEGR